MSPEIGAKYIASEPKGTTVQAPLRHGAKGMVTSFSGASFPGTQDPKSFRSFGYAGSSKSIPNPYGVVLKTSFGFPLNPQKILNAKIALLNGCFFFREPPFG